MLPFPRTQTVAYYTLYLLFFLHSIACISFHINMAAWYSILYFNQCPINRNAICFQAFAITNNVTINNLMYALFSIYVYAIPISVG